MSNVIKPRNVVPTKLKDFTNFTVISWKISDLFLIIRVISNTWWLNIINTYTVELNRLSALCIARILAWSWKTPVFDIRSFDVLF